jgi:hypothetical protein
MGWNSYDSFGSSVNEDEVRANAKMMEVHLKKAGWEYVVIDFCWFYPYVGATNNPAQDEDYSPSLTMDAYSRLLPALDRFPSAKDGKGFKALGDYIHSLGLKFGIHIMRGIPREAVFNKMPIKGTKYTADQIADTTSICSWLNLMYGVDMDKPGAQEYYNSLFEMYASWGVDFVKVDDILSPYYPKEIEAVRKAIDNSGRPMLLSLSPGGIVPVDIAEHLKANANMWRISGDFWDHWNALKENFEKLHNWEDHIGSGHFPDGDMIPFGLLNVRGPVSGVPHRSHFSDIEKYTLMSLWSIARSPLMYGGDLRYLQGVEFDLLQNKEVLEVNQNSSNNHQWFRKDNHVAWVADVPQSNDRYVALFNLGEESETVTADFKALGFNGDVLVRDLWKKQDLGVFQNNFTTTLPAHGSILIRIKKN